MTTFRRKELVVLSIWKRWSRSNKQKYKLRNQYPVLPSVTFFHYTQYLSECRHLRIWGSRTVTYWLPWYIFVGFFKCMCVSQWKSSSGIRNAKLQVAVVISLWFWGTLACSKLYCYWWVNNWLVRIKSKSLQIFFLNFKIAPHLKKKICLLPGWWVHVLKYVCKFLKPV